MALVIGTNCGFVTTAPTSDPTGSTASINNKARAIKDTSPIGDFVVTEIGWWNSSLGSGDANYEAAIYSHNSGDDEPEDIIGDKSVTNSKGTTIGWKRASGLNIPISSETVYWMAIQLDDTGSGVNMDFNVGEARIATKDSPQTTLTDPWGTSDSLQDHKIAIYALVESQSTGTNLQINIGDVWKEVPAVQINIGDAWKEVTGMQINIGDSWKTIF